MSAAVLDSTAEYFQSWLKDSISMKENKKTRDIWYDTAEWYP